jgi:copper chaperone CopZ
MKQKSEGFHPVGNAIFSLYTLEPSTCSRLERALSGVPGIAEVNLNYAADIVQVKFDPTRVTSEDIRTIVKKLGNASSN